MRAHPNQRHGDNALDACHGMERQKRPKTLWLYGQPRRGGGLNSGILPPFAEQLGPITSREGAILCGIQKTVRGVNGRFDQERFVIGAV